MANTTALLRRIALLEQRIDSLFELVREIQTDLIDLSTEEADDPQRELSPVCGFDVSPVVFDEEEY